MKILKLTGLNTTTDPNQPPVVCKTEFVKTSGKTTMPNGYLLLRFQRSKDIGCIGVGYSAIATRLHLIGKMLRYVTQLLKSFDELLVVRQCNGERSAIGIFILVPSLQVLPPSTKVHLALTLSDKWSSISSLDEIHCQK